MFKEIAIEPAAVASSSLCFKYIIEKFGISEGRLIAAFPSKWKRQVFEAAKEQLKGTTDLSRLELRLGKLSNESFFRRGRPGDGCSENWLAAAIAEHARVPFDAIISVDSSESPIVVAVGEVDDEHYCLQPNRQWHIDRDSASMASCCEYLLSNSHHIKLVDPHFDLNKARYRRPFAEFLKHVKPGATIDVFRGDDYGVPFAIHHLEAVLDAIKPPGIQVRMFFQPQGAMHNRFVLTNAGGLYFLTGLDDKDHGDCVTDEVGLLEHAVWQVQWNRYTEIEPKAVWPSYRV